jgi:hypothetical protein
MTLKYHMILVVLFNVLCAWNHMKEVKEKKVLAQHSRIVLEGLFWLFKNQGSEQEK